MNILYVTTFDKKFYDICAEKLLHTFLEYAEGTMLACYEDDIQGMPISAKIIYENIDDDPLLLTWLKDNEDIIPKQYGGKSNIEFGLGKVEMWNFRASRWFRKIVALKRSLEIYDNYDAIIFVDADSEFQKHLSSRRIESIFGDSDIIYHLGMFRKKQPVHDASGIEAGLVGYRGDDGKILLNRLIAKFSSGEFRQYPRWDDGYVLRMVIEDSEDLSCLDLVRNVAMPLIRVMEIGPFRQFIYHDKGKTTHEIFNKGKW